MVKKQFIRQQMNLSPIKSFDYKVDVSSFKNKFIDVDNSLWTEEIKLNINLI